MCAVQSPNRIEGITPGHSWRNQNTTLFTKILILIGWLNWVMLLLWCRFTKHSLSRWVKSFLLPTAILFNILIMLLIWESYIYMSCKNMILCICLYAEKTIPYMSFSTVKWAFVMQKSMGIIFSNSECLVYMFYLLYHSYRSHLKCFGNVKCIE